LRLELRTRSKETIMMRIAMIAAGMAPLLLLLPGEVQADKVPVLMFHNDAGSTGQNLRETILTPANVKVNKFGKLHTVKVDGQIYGQPLYLPDATIKVPKHAGKFDVVFVGTEHDSVYAIDAVKGDILWTRSFINPKAGITPVPFKEGTPNPDLTPEIGITSTMAIDPRTQSLYLTAKTKEMRKGKPHWVYRLHALSVVNGAELPGSPVVIGECTGPNFADVISGPSVNGKGEGGNGKIVRFNALRHMQRPGITPAHNSVYLGFASHGDNVPYHGWVLGYDAKSLKPNAVLNTTPNAISGQGSPIAGGGIWQSGGKLVLDPEGHLYFMTGNGLFDSQLTKEGFPQHGDYGDSFLKLAVDPGSNEKKQHTNGWGLKVVDYFTPKNQQDLTNADIDLGSGGPLALPSTAGSKAVPNLLVGTGKEGKIYLLNRSNMGKFHASADKVVQEVPKAVGGIWGNPAYFRDHKGVQRIYFGGVGDHVKAFVISNAKITVAPSSQTADKFGYPGTTPAISANKDQNGIVWVMDKGRKLLRAYDATNLGKELYNSSMLAADAIPGDTTKFTVPTISNGRVYVVSQSGGGKGSNALVIYGLK
jgi:hypothetical protein